MLVFARTLRVRLRRIFLALLESGCIDILQCAAHFAGVERVGPPQREFPLHGGPFLL